MNSQLHQALGIVTGRAHSEQDLAQLRDVELAQQDAKRDRRPRRRR